MELEIPLALQIALYAAAIGLVVLAVVVVFFVVRVQKQIERVVNAVDAFENEIVPLARESRVAVARVRELSDRIHRAVEVVGDLVLPPMMAVNTTSRVVQTAAATFVRSLWNGQHPIPGKRP